MREGSGRVRDIPEASIGKRWGQEEGASGFVDAEFEGHTASELVSLIVRGNVGGIDAAFHIHLHIWGHIQELHSHQGLCVVHLGQRKRVSPGPWQLLPMDPASLEAINRLGTSHKTYVELFAIVGEVHEVNVAISREHNKASQILSIFISLWGHKRVEGKAC